MKYDMKEKAASVMVRENNILTKNEMKSSQSIK